MQNISLSVGANTGYVDTAAQIAALEQEILVKDEFIQTSGEEFKSSNEEMQSVNEELQSANEELETAKEEMQSINEELSTVNAELQNSISELTRTNNDMNNLLAGTNIATVFVDNQLCLKRFTPVATIIINLITSDIGRPIAHSVLNITGYNSLVADTQRVLDTLIPIEREVQTNNGKWFMMRIHPYRTCNNVIEGATITFFDITETVRMREELDKTNTLSRLAVVLHDARDAVTVQNLDGRIIAWNPSAAKIYGWSETEALAMNASDRIPAQLYEEELNKIRQLMNGELLELFPSQRICRSGKIINVAVIYTALVNQDGLMYAVATTERAKDV